MRSLSQKDEKPPVKETFFYEADKLPDTDHCPSETIIFIQLRQKREIVYANRNFKTTFGPLHRFWGNEFDTWCSLIHMEYQQVIQEQITSFFSAPNLGGVSLLYPVFLTNQGSLLLEHKIYSCQFQSMCYMVNLVTIRQRVTNYFFNPERRRQHPIRQAPPVQISKREKEVLQLIANGYSSKEIADKLFISNHTAISHRKNLIQKFEVRNTAHLIRKAFHFISTN